MKAYEIQTYRDGKWMIDMVFDDAEFAIHEATRIDATRRYSGVRVMEEIYDDATDKTIARVIYRGGWAKDKGAKAKGPQQAQRTVQRTAPSDEPVRRTKRRPKSGSSGVLVPVLILGALILFGLIVLFGLELAFQGPK